MVETVELAVKIPGDLRSTLAEACLGPADPSMRLTERGLRWALLTPAGACGLVLTRAGEARLYGPGARWLEPRLPALLGSEDAQAGGFPEVVPAGPIREFARRHTGLRLPRQPQVWSRLIQVVLLQLVSGKEAVAAWKGLVRRLGQPAPGPLGEGPRGLLLPPTPQAVAAARERTLIAAGVRPKAGRILRLAARESRRLERAAEGGGELLDRVLGALPGIGPWSVAYVRATVLGDPDAVLLGDYDLPKLVAYVLAGEREADDARMLELLEPYRGQRWRVVRLLWLSGARVPRRGPRLPIRTWRGS